MKMLGRDFLLETLRSYDVQYLFGNPGTTELPLMDGLVNYPDIEFILGLHEDIVVGMAAGYAQATGKPGVVNLHAAPGLAHGLGNIYDAYRAGIPLVVTAGQQDSRLAPQEPGLWGDLVTMVKDYTKYSWEVKRVEELPIVLHRAFKMALTHPMGPVFISLPPDVMWQDIQASPIPLTTLAVETRGDLKAIEEAAELIRTANNPIFVAGDRVDRVGAVDELVSLSELVGCAVYQEHQSASMNFPYAHSQFLGRFLPNGPMIKQTLMDSDVVVFFGVISQAPLLYFDKPLISEGTKVIFIDSNEWEIGKNMYVDVPILANPKTVLQELTALIQQNATESDHQKFASKKEATIAVRSKKDEERRAELEQSRHAIPLSPALLMDELNQLLPEDAFIVDESVTTGRYVHSFLQLKRPGSLIALKGGGLGYGMPAALGAQLGRPNERVVSIIGDGSSLYYIQALWNAARYKLPVIYIIANNTSYMILKGGLLSIKGESAKAGAFPGMDISDPEVDFVAVAQGFGIEAMRVEKPDEVRPALEAAFAKRRPILLDVRINREVKPFLA
jgi:benzoylformate decarboxylase